VKVSQVALYLGRPQVSQWRCHAGAGYGEVWLEGARHSYVADPPPLLLETVRQELLLRAAG
jgi:hypothetical protein